MSFSSDFNDTIDTMLFDALGDEIHFFPEGIDPIKAQCAPVDRRSIGSSTWLDDVFARLDVKSVLLECLQTDIGNVSTGCRVAYGGDSWMVSDLMPQNDGVTLLVISPDRHAARGVWK